MLPPFLQRIKDIGHVVFERGQYNINLIGIRSSAARPGFFDDWITCWYKDSGDAWTSHWWPATTDPGQHYLTHPENVDGTAVMAAGQHPRLWQIGKHKTYKAFQQKSPVKVYRDRNLDQVIDFDPRSIQEGMFGINGHASDLDPWDDQDKNREGGEVGKWSAGCQVWAVSAHFRHAVLLAEQSAQLYGNSFTYTLVNSYQLEDFEG